MHKIFRDAYFFYVSIISQPWSPGVSAGFVFMFMPLIQKFCFLVWFSLKNELVLQTEPDKEAEKEFTQWVTGHPSVPAPLPSRSYLS